MAINFWGGPQVISWDSFDPHLCLHMASLDNNMLNTIEHILGSSMFSRHASWGRKLNITNV